MTTEMFKGRPVIGTKMSLRNVGDGLSKAMALRDSDEVEFEPGSTVIVICEALVDEFTMKPAVKGDHSGPWNEVVVLRGEVATITEDKGVRRLLDKHKKDLDERKRLAEELKGQEALDLDDQALLAEEERLAAAEAGA